ncbi:MAG: TIGR04255 family protein [Candidatus Hodarchaeota archaeon]
MEKSHSFTREILKNPPIIEALFEIKWKASKNRDGFFEGDYKFFPGIFSEKIKHSYPEVEILAHARIPDEINPYLPRFRFRKTIGGYPLVQIGPGVLTVNLDKDFTQEKFLNACVDVLNILFEILPDLRIIELSIHYIDAFDFNFESDPFKYLDEKLQTHFRFSPELFEVSGIQPIPVRFNLEASYRVNAPKGHFSCQLRDGVRKSDNVRVLLMDSIFRSLDGELPKNDEVHEWIKDADEVIHKWFYKMIEKSGIK